MYKTQNLEKKSVLITGCSSGIGRATAIFLAQQGYFVYATLRQGKDAEALCLPDLPNLMHLYPLDLTHLDEISAIVEKVKNDLDRRNESGLAALINNAGGGSVAPVELMNLQKFQVELQVRLVGAVAMVQAFLPSLRSARGRIIWIATPAIIPTPYVSSIHACDFAANCLARTLDIELKPWHIPSIQVRCGGIKTAKGLQTTADVQAILQHPQAGLYQAALTRWGQEMGEFDAKRTSPEEVAKTVFRALTDSNPRQRYQVGYMSGLATFLEALPQAIADRVLKSRL